MVCTTNYRSYWIAQSKGLEPPLIEQPQYNMLARDRLRRVCPLYQAPYNMGTTIWSPLASGILTGKYNDGVPRLSHDLKGYEWLLNILQAHRDSGMLQKIANLDTWAKDTLACNVGQLTIAWCVKNPNVSTVLLMLPNPSSSRKTWLA